MFEYEVFGGVLRAPFAFPELRAVRGRAPDWVLQQAPALSMSEEVVLLGDDYVEPGVRVAAYRHDAGFRLVYDDTGTFDVLSDGREISWVAPEGVDVNAARLDVLGRVLAMALHAQGALALHGSAVVLEDRAIAFVAPKHHGKSTLAFAMVSAGAELLTDDTLPVDPTGPVMALPGVHSVRLFGDSVTRLTGDEPAPGDKQTMAGLADDRLRSTRAPLEAVYVLAPTTESLADGAAARRELRSGVEAAIALVTHAKLGALLGGAEAPVLFHRAVSLASAVPVYTLEYVQRFDRLDDVVSQLMDWHGAPLVARARA